MTCPRHPTCPACPDCVPFWTIDEDPIRELQGPGWDTENARRRERADAQSRAITERAQTAEHRESAA